MRKLLICLALGVAGVSTMLAQQLSTTGTTSSGNGGGTHPPAGGTWSQAKNAPPFPFAGCSWLLTDGTVIVMTLTSSGSNGSCYRLTPDNTGSYVNGTWTQIASMNTPRLYFGSAVLPDGRLIACGGEYSGTSLNATWTNACEIYDPVANTWTNISAPPGWGNVGDAPSMVLPNGLFMLGSDFSNDSALFNPATNTWSSTFGHSNAGDFDEDSWTLLPNGNVLDIECQNSPNSQSYNPTTNSWGNLGATPSSLVDSTTETGPNSLLPNGLVFSSGAVSSTCLFNPGTSTWSSGPALPLVSGVQYTQADAPGCMLPNGNVLLAMSPYSPGAYPSPVHMFEYNYTAGLPGTFTQVSDPPIAPQIPSYAAEFLMLPSGQVMMTSFSGEIDFYTPSGTYQSAWQPAITSVSGTLQQGSVNNSLSGTQLNGVSQGASYGDDNSNFTNFPIVRIQNVATGHVFYCKTHNHSTMAVQTGSTVVSTKFDVPAGVEIGPSNLYVVANGIPSAAQVVNVVGSHVVLPTAYSLYRGLLKSGSLASLFFADGNVLDVLTGPTLSSLEAPVQVILTGISPTLTPTSFKFTVTSKVNTTGTNQVISLWNYSTNQYDVLDTRAGTTSNQTVTVTASGTLSHYVSGTGAIQARIAASQTGPTLLYQWGVSIDLANWTIQ